MFDSYRSARLDQRIVRDENARHTELINEMRSAISANEQTFEQRPATIEHNFAAAAAPAVPVPDYSGYQAPATQSIYNSSTVVMPSHDVTQAQPKAPEVEPEPIPEKNTSIKPPKPGIIELANNSDLSVATIAKQAKKINGKDDGETFISLR